MVERTAHELSCLIDTLELTDGDPAFVQLGGPYSIVAKELSGKDYEAHHIPPQSTFDESLGKSLPTIAITKEDHSLTSSYRGRMGSKRGSFLPGGPSKQTHKSLIIDALKDGYLAEMVRNEVYEFRRDYGTRYDGGLKQYILSMIDYIKSSGIPNVRN